MARKKQTSGGVQQASDDEDITFKAPPRDPRLAVLEQVAAESKAWRPAREVLTKVRAVPTTFVQYDRATRVGGHPIERFTTLHGPSNHGKTTFVHGLGLSFLQRGHMYGLVDAEYTTPEDWLDRLMAEHTSNPGFLALRPHTYEETVDAVRSLLTQLQKARVADTTGALHDMSALVAVDSMRKLVPEDIYAKIMKKGASGKDGSVDGMGGRAAQIKAAMNAAWLDELTPLLYHTHSAMVAIARESEDTTADANAKAWGNDWKMTGGKALEFDASLVIRITRASWVKDGNGDSARVVGERHRITIRKTKVAGKADKTVVCHFHTSNGVLFPEGFDRPRDVLELAREYGIVEEAGSWLKWGSVRAQGETGMLKRLHERPDSLAALEALVRERFRPDEALPTGDEQW